MTAFRARRSRRTAAVRFHLHFNSEFSQQAKVDSASVNSWPGPFERHGKLACVAGISIEDGRMTAICSVSNPDKISAE